ncbi:hypothetical protein NQ315_006030 [Exocentrus adspersus]|uniref:Endonuclease/exonuclease/phosphatase domain-containing protein n=1 Tax=Exocentrus adspersus TaxID=1586481 RepID=A0AAV8VB05_9CUCU|nr:hypothetical protein NQ315_006030 [Exocentrus adspersus]
MQDRMDQLEAALSQLKAKQPSSAVGNTAARVEKMANAPVKQTNATSTPTDAAEKRKRGAPDSPKATGAIPKRPATTRSVEIARESDGKAESRTEPTKEREERPPKIPTVVLRKANNWTHVSRLLLSKKAQWSKAKLTLDGVVIHPVSADDHRLITRTLEADKQEYHTYSLQEEKTLRVVVRGIPTGIAEEEVKSDLQAQGFTVLAAHRMTSRKRKEEVRRCCALVVRVEKQRQQAGVNQCHRCQRFGHGQSKCTAQHKCVKCGASHATATCQRPREEPASCANCGGSHPASYRGCEKFPKLAKKTAAAPERNPAPQGNRGNAQELCRSGSKLNKVNTNDDNEHKSKHRYLRNAASNGTIPGDATEGSEGDAPIAEPLMGTCSRRPSLTFLRVASWNINSFTLRKRELQEVVNRLDIDVMAIQETFLIDADRASVPGYTLYRKERQRRRGGVALAMQTIEAIAVGIRTEKYGEITVASCYHPPNRTVEIQDLEALMAIGPAMIAIGDFNAKALDWNCLTQNYSGAELRRFLANNNDVHAVGPEEPTYDGLGRTRPDVLDIALLKAIPLQAQLEVVYEGSSNHSPILLTVGEPTPQVVQSQKDFRAEMKRNTALPRIETVDELEAAVMTLETDIHTAEARSTTETVEIFRQDYVGELPHATKLLIRERRSARRRSIRTGDPVDRNALNQLPRRVRAALDVHFNERWRKHTEEINEGAHDRDFWKTQKILRTQRKPIPLIHGERGIVRTNSEKAEAFADSFELQCRENQLDDEDEDHEEEIERRVRRLNRLPDEDKRNTSGSDAKTPRDLNPGKQIVSRAKTNKKARRRQGIDTSRGKRGESAPGEMRRVESDSPAHPTAHKEGFFSRFCARHYLQRRKPCCRRQHKKKSERQLMFSLADNYFVYSGSLADSTTQRTRRPTSAGALLFK